LEENVKFFEIEAGPNREFLVELDIGGLPSFLFYKDGREFGSLGGVNTRLEEIRELAEKMR